MKSDFANATALLVKAVGQHEVAAALGVAFQTYRQMRTDPSTVSHRRPPADWRARIRPVAAKAAQTFGDWERDARELLNEAGDE